MSDKKKLIRDFFEVVQQLKDTNIIRSEKYLGDIAEFICAEKLGLKLSDDLRQRGYDGILNGKKYQIKSNFGLTTNVTFANNAEQLILFDNALVVIGYQSCLARGFEDGEFRIYEFSKEEILMYETKSGKYSCGVSTFTEKESICTYKI